MKVSLERFLRTGQFGEVVFGMSPQQVREHLGEPDDTGGTSRKYSHPSIYLYGTVEIWFSRTPTYGVIGIYWDVEGKGAFCLPSCCEIEDWDITPGMLQTEIELLLSEWQIPFDSHAETQFEAIETVVRWTLSSGVGLTFDGEGRLCCICSSQSEK
jgi:hypothetical protein